MIMKCFRKGINLGGWLAQYDCNEVVKFTREKISEHFSTYIMEENIAQIASWGLDHVRLPVDACVLAGEEAPYMLDQETILYIDCCVDWCEKYGLSLVLDLHDIKGNAYCQMDHPIPLLTDESIKARFYGIWENLAIHYQNRKKPVIMFELFNEIGDASYYLWQRLYKETIRRIRLIDRDRPILVGSNWQNSVAELNKLDLIDDPYTYYNFHYYEPHAFTHQKAHFSQELKDFGQTIHYPGSLESFQSYLNTHPEYIPAYPLSYGSPKNDFLYMQKTLSEAHEFLQYSERQLYCGEVGVIDTAPEKDTILWLKDFHHLSETYGFGYAIWNYKALDFGLVDKANKIRSEQIIQELFLKTK